ncbi:hypothetical protein [Chryseobacterium carnipullorum]|uniref:hypothetical protein n=1 Tax=Chryseobacterium carnipullorum TaxID=1124835 RepID=UPI000E90C474|nr:hypothetical protein [Chryseobacterium carnipullorum]HBV14942.1 hypothetical protein [Chryseobacterium carnipullorum]
MFEKIKKIEKEFCITDNSVNVYQYRCLTQGFQLNEVLRNPIGFYMHDRDSGVLVRWVDFRIENDKVFAKPCINLSNPRGQRTVDEIEKGFLNAASVGKIVVLEASDDPKLKIPGQEKSTITKWYPREISLVDIPGNYNALSSIYDKDNNELKLSDLKNYSFKAKITKPLDLANILKSLNLKGGGETQVLKAIENLTDKAKKADDYYLELQKLKSEEKYIDRTWDDLYKSDELETVKQKFPELYVKLKKQKFPNIK